MPFLIGGRIPSTSNAVRVGKRRYHLSFNKRIRRLFNIEALRCGVYWKAALTRGRCLFQSKKIYSHKTSKLCNLLIPTTSRYSSEFHHFNVFTDFLKVPCIELQRLFQGGAYQRAVVILILSVNGAELIEGGTYLKTGSYWRKYRCKVANEYFKDIEWVEAVERKKDGPSFPCCPIFANIREWNPDRKKAKNNSRTLCVTCPNQTTKTPERRHWRRAGVFSINFEQISHIILVLPLLNLNK